MMGERQSGQDSLFYGFSLEAHVPGDHILRAIDKFADLGFVREHLKDYYSHTGRPSIDPELMIACCSLDIASAFVPRGDYTRKFILISPIDGFAAWDWMAYDTGDESVAERLARES